PYSSTTLPVQKKNPLVVLVFFPEFFYSLPSWIDSYQHNSNILPFIDWSLAPLMTIILSSLRDVASISTSRRSPTIYL
ncbi:unnamed protein product, partial [Linum tenue]